MFSNAFSQLPTPKLPSLAQHPPINEDTSIMFRVRNCWMVTHAAHDDSGHFGISKPGFKPISSPSLGNCSSYRRKVPGNAGKCFMCIGSELPLLFSGYSRLPQGYKKELVQPLHSSFFYAVNIVHCLWVPKKWLLNCMITNSWLWITIFARLSSPLLLLLL